MAVPTTPAAPAAAPARTHLRLPTWLLLVGGSLGLPYLFSQHAPLRDQPALSPEPDRSQQAGGSPTDPLPAVLAQQGFRPDARIEGNQVDELGKVFRFDVTTSWVLGHWSRVSTQLADLDLQGYRVPLVTGTRPSDLAGSLTYYFNKRQRVERITFTGTTGDARPLVSLLVGRFGFRRELADDAGLYLYRVMRGREVQSELRIRPASVVRASDPHGRFEVALDLRRPPGE